MPEQRKFSSASVVVTMFSGEIIITSKGSEPSIYGSNCGTAVIRSMKMKKQDLPKKVCPVCQRPFSWRKKWANNWPEVVYCSERCRRSKGALFAKDP